MSSIIKQFKYNGVEYCLNTISAVKRRQLKAMKDMYHSSGGFRTGDYLERYPTEKDDYYLRRKASAHYNNIFRPELDASVNPIFAKPQGRNTDKAPTITKKFILNPTGKNQSMTEYMRLCQIKAKIYGSVFLICDAPSEIPLSGVRDGSPEYMPYSEILTPLDIVGYTLDDNGALQSIVYASDSSNRTSISRWKTPYQNKDSVEYSVWLKLSDGSSVFFTITEDNQDGTINAKPYKTFPVQLRETNVRECESEIAFTRYYDIFTMCKKIYNSDSNVDDNYVKNCFAILTYNGSTENLKLGANSVLQFLGDAKQPAFIAPPVQHLDSMNGKIDSIEEDVKSNMNSSVAISSDLGAEARVESDRRRIETLKQEAVDVKDSEQWLVNDALKNFTKEQNFEYEVSYVMDYESLTKKDEIENFVIVGDSGLVNNDVKQQLGVDIIKVLYSHDPERQKKMIKLQEAKPLVEIENNAFNQPTTEDVGNLGDE